LVDSPDESYQQTVVLVVKIQDQAGEVEKVRFVGFFRKRRGPLNPGAGTENFGKLAAKHFDVGVG
jgi:hypothetical protein